MARSGSLRYDLAPAAINHAKALMETVIVDKLECPNTSIIQLVFATESAVLMVHQSEHHYFLLLLDS